MILRWIYSTWNFLIKTAGYLLLFSVLLMCLFLAAIQLPASKDYIRVQLEDTFNNQFAGTVEVESIRGFIPFNTELNEVIFYSPEHPFDRQLNAETIYISVDLWALVTGNIKITSLELNTPDVLLNRSEDGFQLVKIFETERQDDEPRPQQNADRLFERFSIFAPNITIVNGRLEADETISFPQETGINSPFIISDLNADFFLESDENQQFIDINSFTAFTNDPDFSEISLRGQFFNNGHFLELNGFSFNSDYISIQLSAEASPVNLFGENFAEQLSSADYLLDVQRIFLQPTLLQRIDPDLPNVSYSIDAEGTAEGNRHSLFIDNLQITTGESYLSADGQLLNIADTDFTYDFTINNFVIYERDLDPLFSNFKIQNYNLSVYGTPTLQGLISGNLHQIEADLQLQTDQGSSSIDGDLRFEDRPSYEFSMNLDSLDISPLLRDSLGTSVLTGQIDLNGTGFDKTAILQSTFDLSNSTVSTHHFNQLIANLNVSDRSGSYSFQFRNELTDGSAYGNFILGDENQQFSTEAVINRLDITTYFPQLPYEYTNFSGRISANAEGSSIDDLFGRVSIEMNESVIDGDTLRPHQFYADINETVDNSRTLRMTSSFFDARVSGSIFPEKITDMAEYWNGYLSVRIKEEFLFEDTLTEFLPTARDSVRISDIPIDLSLNANVKDLKLLRAYFPNMQQIESSASLNLNINATADALSINGSIYDNNLEVGESTFHDLGISVTGSVNYSDKLRNNALVDFQMNSSDMNINNTSVSGASINLSLRDSVLTLRQQIDRAFENLAYYAESTTIWYPDRHETTLDTLSTGSDAYRWQTVGNPLITLYGDGSVKLDQFALESGEDYIEIDGTFSDVPTDSVNYNIRSLRLSRISELIGGRVQFEGILNGEFTTRSLANIPSIQGDITVTESRINNRIIGDLDLRSRFNPKTDRFDTDIHIYTNPDDYPNYIRANDGIGHDLYLSGYFMAPGDNFDEDEDLFYFDADLREIDMWIVSLIVPTIITEMEGSASGTGFIRGNQNDYNFEATFDIEDVYGLPFFSNVPYTLGGELVFNRHDGLLFNEIILDDGRGGRGTLTGQVDLVDFSPLNILDLRLEMRGLRFMNNVQDPNVPFFADLSGSGTAILEGTSNAPVIRSATPIFLSSNSEISIPLQEETELEQNRRFIQFVESFDNLTPLERMNGRGDNNTEEDSEDADLTFLELFTMNMQFIANNPINVRLIFDPVTNDVLTSTGTGQIRLILEDQDFSMFGRFNISGGEYQFVGGDIFTRRFSIQDGGSISWQGDLVEANLDVTATYRARPDISTLLPPGAAFQRIPIELVLQIGGTISEISNEFYFQVPSGIESTQDPTITAQINRINQNEDEKILQAFGVLLTGNFVPSDLLQNPEEGNVTGANAIVNPLVSTQIISPLLSNQINSLLRSDITFDVDFNLNAFNEVDLGVALRLFNDRIVLRREGQITGESEIGDLGATYRINRTFSLTAFHRQDPTLSNRTEAETRQTQEMNGLGVEAQFQFNTWQSLKNRISNSFRKLFGLKEKEPQVDEEKTDPIAEN